LGESDDVLQRSAPDPTAIIPAFTVPTSLVLHALSLRQLLRRATRGSSRRVTGD
jgi:hypothetical protein